MAAAHAAETDGAVVAAGGDVGRLGAQPVGNGDLADRPARVLGVQDELGLAPDPAAVPVELHGRDPLDGLPPSLLAHPVVALCCAELAVVHQLLEHVGCDAGVGVPLGIAVTVGVEKDARLVERDLLIRAPPVGFHDDVDVEVGQSGDPGAVPLGEQVLADRLDAVGVAHLRGQQRQILRGRVREASTHALLLPGDQRSGRRGDGQTPAQAVGLVVVVDEDRLAVLIGSEAVPAQIADLLGPAPRVDDQFHCDPDVRRRDGIERVHLGAELPHDLLGEVLAGLGILCLIGDVLLSEDHVTGQPVQRLAGAGQSQGTHAAQDLAELGDPLVAAVRDRAPSCCRNACRWRKATMSDRPRRRGSNPWSSRCSRRLSENFARLLMPLWTVVCARLPRRCGSSSTAHAFAASRSQGWLMSLNRR